MVERAPFLESEIHGDEIGRWTLDEVFVKTKINTITDKTFSGNNSKNLVKTS